MFVLFNLNDNHPMKYEYEDDGAGVDVYIIDTYVDIHKFITIYG